MAENKWLGVADPVAQVDTVQILTVDATPANNTFTITINTDTVSVVGDTDVNTTASNLQVALAASTNPYFANITWSVVTDTITGTASAPGNPQTFTSSVTGGGTGTIGSVTSVTASSGPNDWDVARNWDLGTVPVNGDDVIIESGAASITHGLNQSAVTLASLTVKLTFTGRIGLLEKGFTQSSDGGTFSPLKDEFKDQYLQIGATVLTLGENFSGRPQIGSRLIKINLGSVLSAVTVHETASSSFETNLPAVQLLGTNASNNLQVRSGGAGIGIAVHGFEVSTFSDIDIGSDMNSGGVELGDGVTLTNWSQKSGTHFVNAAATIALLSIVGGRITTEGDYTVTLVEVSGSATYFSNHVKTAGNAITTLTFLDDGTVDTLRNSETRTFDTVNLFKGATLSNDKTFLTINTINEPSGPYSLTVE